MLNLNLHQSVTPKSSVTSSCCLPYARRHSTNVQRCTVLLSKAPALGSRIVADRIGWSSVGRQQQQWRGNRGLPALAAVKAPDTTVSGYHPMDRGIHTEYCTSYLAPVPLHWARTNTSYAQAACMRWAGMCHWACATTFSGHACQHPRQLSAQ